jgi:isopenicillin N synthase-like dioxygenase
MIIYTPPTDARDIPVIDLAPTWSSDLSTRKAVAWDIHKACRDTGFFYVKNHGVPEAVMAEQLASARRFFALPLEEKLKLDMARNRGPSGYEPMKLQTLDPGSPPDLKEGFQFHREVDPETSGDRGYRGGNLWPENLPGFRAQMETYHAAVMQLGIRLMGCLALSLDLPEDYFAPGLEDLMCSVRLLHYPPQGADSDRNQLGAGAHTDWGSITMLLQDDCGGLEVRHASGEWMRATPVPGALIVNLGDMVRRWTNDIYHSTMHRVLNNVANRDRYSVAAFFNPNYNYRVTCLPTCLTEGVTPLYAPCTVGEHIKEMFERTYGRKAAPEPVA